MSTGPPLQGGGGAHPAPPLRSTGPGGGLPAPPVFPLRLPPLALLLPLRFPVFLLPAMVEGLPGLDGCPLRLGVPDPLNGKPLSLWAGSHQTADPTDTALL